MTRRIEALQVTLDEPTRIDDAQAVMDAIRQLESVADVEALDVDRTALATLRHRMRQKTITKVDEAFNDYPEGFEE